MNQTTVLLSSVVGIYTLGFASYLREFVTTWRPQAVRASHFVEGGFLIHTLAIFIQVFTFQQGTGTQLHLPVTTVGEASGFFAWALAFVYLILVKRFKTESFGLVLAPVLVFFLIPALFPFRPHPVPRAYVHNTYFLLHTLSAFFGYASFALSFIAGILYLVQDYVLKHKVAGNIYDKLPSLEDLERLSFRTILWGILLLGGAIATGALWSKNVFGTLWLWEPKSFASLLTWCAYLGIIYLREFSLVKGTQLMRFAVIAFLLVLFTFLGTSVFQAGLHVGIW